MKGFYAWKANTWTSAFTTGIASFLNMSSSAVILDGSTGCPHFGLQDPLLFSQLQSTPPSLSKGKFQISLCIHMLCVPRPDAYPGKWFTRLSFLQSHRYLCQLWIGRMVFSSWAFLFHLERLPSGLMSLCLDKGRTFSFWEVYLACIVPTQHMLEMMGRRKEQPLAPQRKAAVCKKCPEKTFSLVPVWP